MDDTSTTVHTQHKKTATSWLLIEIEDKEGREDLGTRTRRVAIEVVRETLTDIHNAETRVVSAAITLSAHLLDSSNRFSTISGGSFGGKYNYILGGEYKLTCGSILLPETWRGLHIGTYMQNQVMHWAKGEIGLPGKIVPISVVSGDALNEAERDRRNRFYEQFGIRFLWSEPVNGIERANGRSDPSLTINDLCTLDAVNGIRAFQLPGALHDLALRTSDAERQAHEAKRAQQESKKWHEREVAVAQGKSWLFGVIAIIGVILALLALWLR